MTKQEFKELTDKGTVILDGATGSCLRTAGMPVGVCAETWILEHPEVLMELQRAYAQAGSQIVYAPTFGANRISLGLHGKETECRRLNRELTALSREAVGDQVWIAGDLTTTGQMLCPAGDLSYEALYEIYVEQIEALAEAGVDLLVAETMMSVEETMVALDAAQNVCDLPVMCSLTLEADGTALYGGNAVEAVETLQEMGASAVGLNCSVGPDQLIAVVASMKRAAKVPILAKPNAGIPRMDHKGIAHYSMNCETFAGCMKELAAAGADLVGGCCGTNPEYIKEMVRVLSEGKTGGSR